MTYCDTDPEACDDCGEWVIEGPLCLACMDDRPPCGHTDGWCGGPVRCTRGPRTWTRADEYDPPPPDNYADDRAADRAADKEQERLQHDWRRA